MPALELLWLLLPIAAASGWMAAKRSERRVNDRKSSAYDSNPAYFRGLNHLLNEEPDKAIDVFVEMLAVDSETVETHLALGNLFRRRGEVERAIRIHQNLTARPALTREQRAEALLELGKDYMRAGLYDRAENLFKELRDSKLHVVQALRNLRSIYQQEKDWEACLSVTEALQPLVNDSLGVERAHYFCELAATAIAEGRVKRAKDALKTAMVADPDCVRALHMQADLAMRNNDFNSAIRLYHQAAERDPEYLPEVMPDLVEAYKQADDDAGLRQYLDGLLAQRTGGSVDLIVANLVKETDGDAAAAQLLGERVRQSPSLKGLLRLVELNACIPEKHAAEVLLGLREHIRHLVDERPQYQCHKCGFAAKTLHWQCPSCRCWGSVRRKPDIDDCIQVKT